MIRLGIAVALTVALGGSLEGQCQVMYTRSTANVRSAPTIQSEILDVVSSNQPVRACVEPGPWLAVWRGDSRFGFIHGSLLSPRPADGNCWQGAGGNIWSGVQLFFGDGHIPVGTVLGGTEQYISPTGQRFRGIKIRYPNGLEEWKDRDIVIRGAWYVRCEDPALDQRRWLTIDR